MPRPRRRTDIPEAMISRFKDMGLQLDEFLPALLRPPSQTLRLNTLKASREGILESLSYLDIVEAPWNDLVFRVRSHSKLGNLLEHFLGLIYVQDSSSTMPVTVLDPQPGETILDIAAAPGSKTTQIAAAMKNTGVLVANDANGKRIPALTSNLDRSGVLNTVVTNIPGQSFGYMKPETFDRILVDAPCTSEGTLSRSLSALEIWSDGTVERLSYLQKKLILSAYYSLKAGGTIVYSTCTFEPEENEGVICHLLKHFPEAQVEPVVLEGVPLRKGYTSWRGEEYDQRSANVARVFPHEHDGEGFCIAKILKPL
ncbi:RsmB/NOP family class I SAM-dependent RNA methyltransferase [bacterium]|nr:RsmB/NOP family class I SAM-dependent RNA methyltransferase [bacterium]